MDQHKQLATQLERLKSRVTWLARGTDFEEDLYQDVVLICLRTRHSIDWAQDQAGFILRAARNRWVDHLRDVKRRKTHLIRYAESRTTVSGPPDVDIEHAERSAAVRCAVADLPARYREAVCRLTGIDSQPGTGPSPGVCNETWRTRQKRALRRMATNPRLRCYAPDSSLRAEQARHPIASRDSHV